MMKKRFQQISCELTLVLTALLFPSLTGLWAGGWTFAATLVGYPCCIALCVLDGRWIKTVRRRPVFVYALCVILPMALLVLLDQRTPLDLLVNLLLALVCIGIGYRTKE